MIAAIVSFLACGGVFPVCPPSCACGCNEGGPCHCVSADVPAKKIGVIDAGEAAAVAAGCDLVIHVGHVQADVVSSRPDAVHVHVRAIRERDGAGHVVGQFRNGRIAEWTWYADAAVPAAAASAPVQFAPQPVFYSPPPPMFFGGGPMFFGGCAGGCCGGCCR